MAGQRVIQPLFDVDKYVQEDIDMYELSKALAAMDAIYNLLDTPAAKLTRTFDPKTNEHTVTLEYRFCQPADETIDRGVAAGDRDAMSVLRYMLAST
jgi:hypothetical protein